jgi:DNA-nicking Smr family endonuclease
VKKFRPPKRGASAEEHALFQNAMKDTKPLAKRERVAHAPRPFIPFIPPWRIAKAPVFPDLPAGPIGGHVEARLRRGRGEVEARLDLHGFTHQGAYRTLMRFLMEAQAEGKRLVLVITGKGGVLRAQLPLWLGQEELKLLVGGISEAHASHGGSGAFYVSLKRQKKLEPR